MIILDTDVVSELMRPEPSSLVQRWIQGQPAKVLFTTSVTVAEVRYGIARMRAGQRRDAVRQAANEVFNAFPGQVLPFDLAAADAYADLVARRDRLGQPIDGFDAQIAAICRTHAATLATRNSRDFADVGVTLIDPWVPEAP